jgi:hypothetical protein
MLSPGANTITATYAGNTGFASSNSAAVTVSEPGYSVTASETSLTVTPGSNGSVSLTVTPVGGYNGTVAMSCATSLAGVTCSFTPASYTLDGSNTVLTGTVALAASSSAAAFHPLSDRDGSHVKMAAVLWLPGGAALLLVAFERRHLMRTLRTRQLILLLALLGVAAGLFACGGGGGGGGGGTMPQPVTGMVTITAAGSTGNVSQSLQLTITVQ